jgi:hypothetical protein
MKRLVIQATKFSNILDKLIVENKLSKEDFIKFEEQLVTHPDLGDVIQGTGGLRKARLRSSSKGKSGGFRVCYCDVPEKGKLFLVAIFPKNVQEDLSSEEKRLLKRLVDILKAE